MYRSALFLLIVALLTGCGSSETNTNEDSNKEQNQQIDDGQQNDQSGNNNQQDTTSDSNKLGAWLWYIDQAGLVKGSHSQMAGYLAEQGVKRIFIKISDPFWAGGAQDVVVNQDGTVSCGDWQDACEPANLQLYKDVGIEPWAWTYNYPEDPEASGDSVIFAIDADGNKSTVSGTYAEQVDMIEAAARIGYKGFIMDVEVEFDNAPELVETLMSLHRERLDQLINEGVASTDFKLGVTTWGNPADHGMAIDIIDQYADFHMPQTYVEKWGGSWLTDIANTIKTGDCEYRSLGATKPIWHIVSHEDGIMTGETLDTFIQHAGPNASLWRISGIAEAVEFDKVNWQATNFTENDCTQNNFDLD